MSVSLPVTLILVSPALAALFFCGTVQAAEDLAKAEDVLHSEIESLLELTPSSAEIERAPIETFSRFERVIHDLARMDDLETARMLAMKCTALFPGQMRSEVLLGWVLGLSGEVQDAVSRIQEGLGGKTNLLPDSNGRYTAEAEINLAGFLIQVGRYEDAVQLLNQVQKEEPDLALPDYLRGLAHFHLGDPFSTAMAYQSAMRKDSSLATANDYLQYIWAIDKMGRMEEARKALQKAVERFPMTPGFYLNLGLNAEARNATAEAYCHFQMETLVGGEGSPYTGQARIRIARVEERAGVSTFLDDDARWIVRYVQLRALSSEDEEEDRELGQKADRLLTRLRKTELAEHPFLIYLAQERLMELGETDKVIGLLEMATAKFPGQVLFEIDLAKAYGQVGESTKSVELLEKALMAQPDHWKVREAVGPAAFSPSKR